MSRTYYGVKRTNIHTQNTYCVIRFIEVPLQANYYIEMEAGVVVTFGRGASIDQKYSIS